MATSIRVGNELGAGNPLRAKRAAYTALGLIRMFHNNIIHAVIYSKDYSVTKERYLAFHCTNGVAKCFVIPVMEASLLPEV